MTSDIVQELVAAIELVLSLAWDLIASGAVIVLWVFFLSIGLAMVIFALAYFHVFFKMSKKEAALSSGP